MTLIDRKWFLVLLVNFAVPLGGMSTDIYLPSLPAMTHYFHSSSTAIQLTITLFTLGLGVGQCIAGPISDAIGRKKPLLFGLVLQFISVLFITNSHAITGPIIARLFQGFGAAFMMVPARAVLNDLFEGPQLKKHYTYITTSFGLGPIVAPFLGGYLQHYFGWQANFYFVLIYALILILATLIAKESHTNTKTFSLQHVTSSYKTVMTNRAFRVNAILVSFFLAYVAIFNVTGPFIIQRVLDKSAVFYGYVALIMGLAWLTGNLTNRFFYQVSTTMKSRLFLALIMLTSCIMLLLGLFTSLSVITLVLPVFIIIYSGGLLFPAYVSECLSLFKAQAASANGLLFSFIWLVFSLFTFIGAGLKLQSMTPAAVCYVIMALVSLLWFYLVCLKKADAN